MDDDIFGFLICVIICVVIGAFAIKGCSSCSSSVEKSQPEQKQVEKKADKPKSTTVEPSKNVTEEQSIYCLDGLTYIKIDGQMYGIGIPYARGTLDQLSCEGG